MAGTDSVSIFTEGTFEEQILELVNYLARSLAEERATYIQPFQDALTVTEGQKPIAEDLERRRNILTMILKEVKGLGDGSEREIEGFFNLLFSHFLELFPLDSPETKSHLDTLLHTIASSSEQTTTKYRILSNLFNAIPRRSGLRLLVYKTLLQIASENDELELLGLSDTDVENWLQEWEISPEEKSAFLKLLVDAFAKCGEPERSYQFQLSYVRSLPSSSSPAQAAAIDAIAIALRLPSYFNFDELFRLDAVIAAKDHELFSLLHIFLNDGLAEYKAWAESHAGAFSKYELDPSQLQRKIRLLTLATLGFQNIGRDLPYSLIASGLQVEPSQVETWVIDVIRAGLLSGKLSQTTQTLHVTRATARSFEREEWELLGKRLQAWKSGLVGVLEVIAATRKKNTPEPTQANTSASSGVETPVPAAQAAVA
ncbi:Eukaryotic translation initiation factor 3 subunit M [Grifola frondosa]|uniref:Eukaryotic translation initiation factor 3 subunit M n=1 Tax=Grifola frondosa TaxID=5627 RepID=A0A1C7LZW0_GRIFR|nr:Eukaryotic translation initiation factor 3 subunit M [Grifola frondosa]